MVCARQAYSATRHLRHNLVVVEVGLDASSKTRRKDLLWAKGLLILVCAASNRTLPLTDTLQNPASSSTWTTKLQCGPLPPSTTLPLCVLSRTRDCISSTTAVSTLSKLVVTSTSTLKSMRIMGSWFSNSSRDTLATEQHQSGAYLPRLREAIRKQIVEQRRGTRPAYESEGGELDGLDFTSQIVLHPGPPAIAGTYADIRKGTMRDAQTSQLVNRRFVIRRFVLMRRSSSTLSRSYGQ